jgi:hypothetical protein
MTLLNARPDSTASPLSLFAYLHEKAAQMPFTVIRTKSRIHLMNDSFKQSGLSC